MLTDVRHIKPHTTERVTEVTYGKLIQKIDVLGFESPLIATFEQTKTNCTLSSFVGGAA